MRQLLAFSTASTASHYVHYISRCNRSAERSGPARDAQRPLVNHTLAVVVCAAGPEALRRMRNPSMAEYDWRWWYTEAKWLQNLCRLEAEVNLTIYLSTYITEIAATCLHQKIKLINYKTSVHIDSFIKQKNILSLLCIIMRNCVRC